MGTVVCSVDAELAWGFHDQDRLPKERLQHARAAWLTLLDLFERYEVPATWAVVGHLMLQRCDGDHREHPSPPGWFARDPGGSAARGSLWFAPDLIDAIRDAGVDHELASHSFSHLPFGGDDVTPEMVDAELSRHRDIAAEWDESLDSFVFPRNAIAHRDRLAAHEFVAYRGAQPGHRSRRMTLRRAVKAIDLTLARRGPPLVVPTVDEYGLVNIPASLDLFGFEGTPRTLVETVTSDPIVAAVQRGVRNVERTAGVLHVWLHPNNITGRRDLRRLKEVLDIVSASDASIRTMGSVACRIQQEDMQETASKPSAQSR